MTNSGGGIFIIHLCPSLDSVLHHETLGHGRRDVDHVVAVVLLAHSGLPVAADGEAQILFVC